MMLIIAAPTAGRLRTDGSTMLWLIVIAIFVPIRPPMILKTTAMSTATRVGSTPVETTVTIAFGASVHPLTRSAYNTSPTTNRNPKKTSSISGLLPRHGEHDHRTVFNVVRDSLQKIDQIFPRAEFSVVVKISIHQRTDCIEPHAIGLTFDFRDAGAELIHCREVDPAVGQFANEL